MAASLGNIFSGAAGLGDAIKPATGGAKLIGPSLGKGIIRHTGGKGGRGGPVLAGDITTTFESAFMVYVGVKLPTDTKSLSEISGPPPGIPMAQEAKRGVAGKISVPRSA